MGDVKNLSEQEKIFLAGAIKALILAGGSVFEQELDDLDKLVRGLEFHDFDECLERFEAEVRDDEDFQLLAQNILHPDTKHLITRILWDLAIQRGVAQPEETRIIRLIQTWWKD